MPTVSADTILCRCGHTRRQHWLKDGPALSLRQQPMFSLELYIRAGCIMQACECAQYVESDLLLLA